MANQRFSASAWRDRVAQWRSSGLSAQAYAEQYSVPAERLNYWARRLAREARAAQLLPVRVQCISKEGNSWRSGVAGLIPTTNTRALRQPGCAPYAAAAATPASSAEAISRANGRRGIDSPIATCPASLGCK
jgi:hypothetical protein